MISLFIFTSSTYSSPSPNSHLDTKTLENAISAPSIFIFC